MLRRRNKHQTTLGRVRNEATLDVEHLTVQYHSEFRDVLGADDVTFSIQPHESFGLAGESGCGKSTVANAIMRLLQPPAEVIAGAVTFGEVDVLKLEGENLREFRWTRIAMVFQSALNALNPVITIGDQITDTFQAHTNLSKKEIMERAGELLGRVNISADRLRSYPHQLSGGQRQRVVIAIALALDPDLLILDEPTTALDVVVQQEIMEQIRHLQKEFGFSILFITHDISLMVQMSDRMAVMYNGRIVEMADSQDIFARPMHPYTQALMGAFPPIVGERRKLTGLKDPATLALAEDVRNEIGFDPGDIPDLTEVEPGHWLSVPTGTRAEGKEACGA